MPFFQNDGINFHYRDEGWGLPFVFQHGLGGDVTQPTSLFQPPPRFRLISFDCRAHGQTQPVGDPEKVGFATFGDDLLALLEYLGVRRAVVGGISMGAALALHFALRFPARVLGLVLSRPAWLEGPRPWNVKMFTLIADLIRQHGVREGRERFLQTDDYRQMLAECPDTANSFAMQFLHPRAEEGAFKLERLINDRPHPDRAAWATVKVPTLVLANRQDPVHPFEVGEELARAIPGAELREITSKSVSLEQHAADVQRHLEEFLKRRFAGAA